MTEMMRTIDPVDEWIGRRLLDRSWPRWPESWRSRLLDSTDLLRVEERREDGAVVIRAEIPGIDPERDVDISVTDHTLHIEAHREQRHEAASDGRVRSEFRYGSFSRSIALPPGVTEDEVAAEYRDGILEVRIPVTTTVPESHHVTVHRA